MSPWSSNFQLATRNGVFKVLMFLSTAHLPQAFVYFRRELLTKWIILGYSNYYVVNVVNLLACLQAIWAVMRLYNERKWDQLVYASMKQFQLLIMGFNYF